MKDDIYRYQKLYGDIVFPDNEGSEQSARRREIYACPVGWMYSFDGLKWRAAPMDIGKIDYPRAYFRRIPTGITVDVSEEVKQNPALFMYSSDNGHSWHDLMVDGFPSGHVWVYHGDHSSKWFRKMYAVLKNTEEREKFTERIRLLEQGANELLNDNGKDEKELEPILKNWLSDVLDYTSRCRELLSQGAVRLPMYPIR